MDAINQISNNAKYVGDFAKIEEWLEAKLQPGDVVLTMGAGQANLFGIKLLDRLRSQSQAVF